MHKQLSEGLFQSRSSIEQTIIVVSTLNFVLDFLVFWARCRRNLVL